MKTNNATVAYNGRNYRVFEASAFGQTINIILVPDEYRSGTFAVRMLEVAKQLIDSGSQNEAILEPYAVITTNIPNFSLMAAKLYSYETAFVKDYSENSWVPAFLEKYKLAEKTDMSIHNGYVTMYAWTFDTSKFYAEEQKDK